MLNLAFNEHNIFNLCSEWYNCDKKFRLAYSAAYRPMGGFYNFHIWLVDSIFLLQYQLNS